MGTALTSDQLAQLLRFTDHICMVFDGDAAGRQAAIKSMKTALPLLEPAQRVSFLTLPDGKDPDEFIRSEGPQRFAEMVKTAPTLSQFMLSKLVEDHGTEGRLITAEAKTQFRVDLDHLLGQMRPGNHLRQAIAEQARKILGQEGARAGLQAPAQPAYTPSPVRNTSRRACGSDCMRRHALCQTGPARWPRS